MAPPLTVAQADVLEALQNQGRITKYALHRKTVEALIRRSYARMDENDRVVITEDGRRALKGDRK